MKQFRKSETQHSARPQSGKGIENGKFCLTLVVEDTIGQSSCFSRIWEKRTNNFQEEPHTKYVRVLQPWAYDIQRTIICYML